MVRLSISASSPLPLRPLNLSLYCCYCCRRKRPRRSTANSGEQTVPAGSTLGNAPDSLSQSFEAEAGRLQGLFVCRVQRQICKKYCFTVNPSHSSGRNPRARGGAGGGSGGDADGTLRSKTWAATTTKVEDLSRRVHPLGGRERFLGRRGQAGELASGRCLRGESHHV